MAMGLRFQGDILYTIGSLLTSVVAVFGSLVAARCLLPEEMGIMQTILLFPVYCSFLHFGVFNGLSRNIAFAQGVGNQSKVQEMVNASWWTAKCVAFVGALLGLVAGLYYSINSYSPLYVTGMIAVFLLLVAEPISQHLEIVYLSSRNFKRLGVCLLWQNTINLAAICLPALAGVGGFIAAKGIYAMSRVGLRLRNVPIKSSQSGSITEVRELAVVGMPLLIAGTLYSLLAVADRSVIACYLTPTDVGHYTLAGLVVTGVQFVPLCIATLIYPRMSACYGKTGNPLALRRYFWLLLGLNTLVILPVCAIGYFAVEPFTRHLLPNYMDGVPAAKLTCISSCTFVHFGVTSVIAVMRRNTLYIVAIAVSLALVWLLGGMLIARGYGIMGAVLARAVASALLCGITIAYAYWLTTTKPVQREGERT